MHFGNKELHWTSQKKPFWRIILRKTRFFGKIRGPWALRWHKLIPVTYFRWLLHKTWHRLTTTKCEWQKNSFDPASMHNPVTPAIPICLQRVWPPTKLFCFGQTQNHSSVCCLDQFTRPDYQTYFWKKANRKATFWLNVDWLRCPPKRMIWCQKKEIWTRLFNSYR